MIRQSSTKYTCHWVYIDQIKSNQIKSNQIKSNQIKSNQIKSNQIKSNQIKSNQIKSNQIKSNQIKSNQIKSNQIKSNQIKSNQITLLSLKMICILQLMITSKIYGMVTTKCKWISRCIHYKNNSTGWHQYDSFNIQHSNGHRDKTPAIARCFTFYTTISPLRRKYMEERRERVGDQTQ